MASVSPWKWRLAGAAASLAAFAGYHVALSELGQRPGAPSWTYWLVLTCVPAVLGALLGGRTAVLRERATRDPLTGLYNRYVWENALNRFAKAHPGRQLSLMLIDIDDFKLYNDRFGHQVGDRLLQAMSRSITRAVRSTDIVGRYGGEEFIIVLPEVDRERARQIGERLVEHVTRSIAAWAREHRLEPAPTISVGVATADQVMSHPLSDLLDRADRAMYTAKELGNSISYAS